MYLTVFLLKKHNHETIEAFDGPEGIAAAKAEKPDMILLDIQLPEMDGYAVATALKADKESAHIPIVAVTSYAMTGDRERVLEVGCKGYIEKPINPETFVKQIENFMV